jgi:molecular chaperone DnaK (HSP70)
MNMPPIIGIDLGTTNSLMAYLDHRTGLPRVIPAQKASVRFTFFWTAVGRWEGRDFQVGTAQP